MKVFAIILAFLLISHNYCIAETIPISFTGHHLKFNSALPDAALSRDTLTKKSSIKKFNGSVIYTRPFSIITGHFDLGYEKYLSAKNGAGILFRYFQRSEDVFTQTPEPHGIDGTLYFKRVLSKKAPTGWFVRLLLIGGWYHANIEYQDCSKMIYGDGMWHCTTKYVQREFFTAGYGITFGHQWVNKHVFVELAATLKHFPIPDKIKSFETYDLNHLWGNLKWTTPQLSPGGIADFNFSVGYKF